MTWQRFNEWSLDFLADYIVNTHHAYVKSALPLLALYTHKLSNVHGGRHPELVEIHKLFQLVDKEMTGHMVKK